MDKSTQQLDNSTLLPKAKRTIRLYVLLTSIPNPAMMHPVHHWVRPTQDIVRLHHRQVTSQREDTLEPEELAEHQRRCHNRLNLLPHQTSLWVTQVLACIQSRVG